MTEVIIRTLRKMCDCRSSASGPRFIIRAGNPRAQTSDSVEVVVELTEFACDACDESYIPVED